jgi:itaconate CoA-transferase
MSRPTILSLEQALSMPSATLRFVHHGWRVIKVEAYSPGQRLPGDPNRYIGKVFGDEGRRSYFIAPNVGKHSIALDLKHPLGRKTLRRVVAGLPVDVFCCNTLPGRYRPFGIDYATLAEARPGLIWAGISAMGPDHPDTPGYDPATQALVGYTGLTGWPDGAPTLCGVPLIDLKAGDDAYAAIWLALAERAANGRGREIHISMLHSAASWLVAALPGLDLGGDAAELTRWGNGQARVAPVGAYRAADGFVVIAVTEDHQWQRLVALAPFAALGGEYRLTNAQRLAQRAAIDDAMGGAVGRLTCADLSILLEGAAIPHARVNSVAEVRDRPAVAAALTTTRTPDGQVVRLPPMAVEVAGAPSEFAFPPRYGEHTASVLAEAGLSAAEIADLAEQGVIPGSCGGEADPMMQGDAVL